jgi:hypothetical protein
MEAADHDEEPPQVTQLQQRNRYLRRALEKLSDRERVIIGARYALTEEEEQTLAMLAHRLNLSIERVRQIERAALQKLGHALADMGVSASSLFWVVQLLRRSALQQLVEVRCACFATVELKAFWRTFRTIAVAQRIMELQISS